MLARVPIQAWTKPRVAETSQQRRNERESTQESSDPPRLNRGIADIRGRANIKEILRGWLHRLPRRRPYAFGFQNSLNKLGFRIAVGITIALVLVGQIRFQSRISRPRLHVSPQQIPEHDQRSKTRMIVLDYL